VEIGKQQPSWKQSLLSHNQAVETAPNRGVIPWPNDENDASPPFNSSNKL
jgi:hypothetical protein